MMSDNNGESWVAGGSAPAGQPDTETSWPPQTNECAVAELPNGTVVMNARNYIGKANHTGNRQSGINLCDGACVLQ